MTQFDNNARLAVGSDGRSATLTGLESPAPSFPSRSQAKALGLKRYYTGKPCPQGHVAERRTNNKECVACHNGRSAAWYAANPDKARAKDAAWRAANPEQHYAYSAAWYAANPEKVRARVAAWRAANPAKHCAYAANRRAMKLKQRCTCCTNEQIEDFYVTTALYSGHVDHIIPLALGGHHCAKNLQAMTDVDHREKTKQDHRAIADARRRSRLLRSRTAPTSIGQIT